MSCSAPAPAPSLPNYSLTERIGTGSYGSVFKAHFKNGPRDVVAVKCVRKSGLAKHEVDNIVNEISLLKKLKHPQQMAQKEHLALMVKTIKQINHFC